MNAEAILDRFLRSRIGTQNGNGFCLFDHGIRLDAKVTWGPQHPQGRVVMVVFRAVHDSSFPNGITDFAVAAGESHEQALGKACSTWLEGTGPVLEMLVKQECRHDSVDVFDIAVVNSLNKQLSSWEMLRGPLQAMGYGDDWAEAASGMNDCILKTIIDACTQTGVFVGRRPRSIRWSIARSPGEPYHGDCRLDRSRGFPVERVAGSRKSGRLWSAHLSLLRGWPRHHDRRATDR